MVFVGNQSKKDGDNFYWDITYITDITNQLACYTLEETFT
jgi:hypothetical protein